MFVHPARKLLKAGSHTGAVSLVTGEGASGRSFSKECIRFGRPTTILWVARSGQFTLRWFPIARDNRAQQERDSFLSLSCQGQLRSSYRDLAVYIVRWARRRKKKWDEKRYSASISLHSTKVLWVVLWEEGRAFNWLDASTIACLEEIPYTSEPSVDDGLWVYELKEETDDAPPLNLERYSSVLMSKPKPQLRKQKISISAQKKNKWKC